MRREAIGRLIIRLYPDDVQETSGGELVGTLLDAGDTSTAAYLLQLGSLARSGLWARATVELTKPLGQTALSALCWLAVLNAMSLSVVGIGTHIRWGGNPGSSLETITHFYILPALILAMFTLRRNRTSGVLGLLWLALFVYQHQKMAAGAFLAAIPLQAIGFALLAAKPNKPLPAGRFLWPFPTLVWLLYQVTLIGELSGVGKVSPVLASLVLLPWAPALSLGMALDWGLIAINYLDLHHIVGNDPHLLLEAAEFALCIPVALLAVSVARRTFRSTRT